MSWLGLHNQSVRIGSFPDLVGTKYMTGKNLSLYSVISNPSRILGPIGENLTACCHVMLVVCWMQDLIGGMTSPYSLPWLWSGLRFELRLECEHLRRVKTMVNVSIRPLYEAWICFREEFRLNFPCEPLLVSFLILVENPTFCMHCRCLFFIDFGLISWLSSSQLFMLLDCTCLCVWITMM